MSLAHYQDPDERDDARYDATLNQRLDPLPPDHPIMRDHAESVRQYHALIEERRERRGRECDSEAYRECQQEIAGRFA